MSRIRLRVCNKELRSFVELFSVGTRLLNIKAASVQMRACTLAEQARVAKGHYQSMCIATWMPQDPLANTGENQNISPASYIPARCNSMVSVCVLSGCLELNQQK